MFIVSIKTHNKPVIICITLIFTLNHLGKFLELQQFFVKLTKNVTINDATHCHQVTATSSSS